jgi:hypothetical protein
MSVVSEPTTPAAPHWGPVESPSNPPHRDDPTTGAGASPPVTQIVSPQGIGVSSASGLRAPTERPGIDPRACGGLGSVIAGREVVRETSGRAGTLRLQSPEDRFQFLAGGETVLLEGFDTLAQLSEGLGLRLMLADEPLVLRPQAGQALGFRSCASRRLSRRVGSAWCSPMSRSKRLFTSACPRVRDPSPRRRRPSR